MCTGQMCKMLTVTYVFLDMLFVHMNVVPLAMLGGDLFHLLFSLVCTVVE